MTIRLPVLLWLLCGVSAMWAQDRVLGPAQQTAVTHVSAVAPKIRLVNRSIWELAEVGLQEQRSSALLVDRLRDEGFEVETGIAGLPTAFVASYGSGEPVIALLAEYDALPGMSQKVAPRPLPVVAGNPGHACGHSGLAAGSFGGALAIKRAMDRHGLAGTLRLYGTPAEETVIGKVYMSLAGVFDDVDVCIHWHPGSKHQAWTAGSKALISAKFSFKGISSHASLSPEMGRSALDAVELMNVGANYMREHLKDDARIHYVITHGGGAPNVVPPDATVWYFCRANQHEDVERNFQWLKDIAAGAAMMTQTQWSVQVDTDCHELVLNTPLSDLITDNLGRIERPEYSEEELLFARRMQEPLTQRFGKPFALAMDRRVHRSAAVPGTSGGSTDVGDISWHVPTGGLTTACFVSESPGHSWQNVSAIGSTIGEKGILYAAKAMAVTVVDLLENPELVAAARNDWKTRMKGRRYTSLIPEGQAPPVEIR